MPALREQQAAVLRVEESDLGYELLIRPRAGQPPLPESELRAWLGRAQREGIRAGARQPPAEAPALEAPRQAPSPPPATTEGAAPAARPAQSEQPPPSSGRDGDPGAPPEAPKEPAAWELANGRGALRARFCGGGGGLGGADLEVPFGGAEEELRAAVDFALSGAAELGGTVFDPQLAREVSRESTEEIVERWRLSQHWAVDVAGTAEDLRSTLAFTPAPPLFQLRHKIALGILIGLGLLFEALGLVVDAMR